jgi:succinyl-diaminopimelate desuccinylase
MDYGSAFSNCTSPDISKGAIRTATAFISDAIGAVESMSFDMPDDIAQHMKSPEVLAIVDKAMGEGTSTIIARPTVNVGTIRGGTKVNVIPDHCEFELDIRLPIGLTAEAVMAVLHSIIAQPKFSQATIELQVHEAASNPSSFSTLNNPMTEFLKHNIDSLMPSAFALPIPSMGATDCKHYRYAGIPAYAFGCSPYSSKCLARTEWLPSF